MKTFKNILSVTLFFAFLGLLFYKFGGELLVPGAVKKVRPAATEDLQEAADKSAAKYRDNLESAEKTAVSYEKLGRQYAEQGNWTPAIDALSTAIEYGANSANVHYYLGAAYANRAKETNKKEDIRQGEAHYKMALEKNPSMASAKYGLGLLTFYLKNEKQTGISIMKALVSEQPSFYNAGFALARFYYETGEAAVALPVYERLYDDLSKQSKSSETTGMMENCKANISRIRAELGK